MELLTTITTHIAQVGIELLDIVAMGILLYGSGKSIWMMIRHMPGVTLYLTRFMNIALIVMLCAEIIRLVLGALSVFRHLPVFGYADHLLGLLLGLVQGLLIVWGLFLVLSLFAATQAGAQLMNEIHGSAFLSTLYNLNPFLYSAAGAIKGIM